MRLFQVLSILLFASNALCMEGFSSPRSSPRSSQRRSSCKTDSRRSASSSILVASISPRENRLASIPQIEVTDSENAGKIFSPLSILNCFGTMNSRPSNSTPFKVLEDRFLTEIFSDRNILIVHDGRYVFYVRQHDSIVLAKLYCGHITEVLKIGEKIFVQALVVDFTSCRSLLSAELREYELGLCEASAKVVEQSNVKSKKFLKWGNVIDALILDGHIFVLEDRGHTSLLNKIDLRFGAQDQYCVEGLNSKECHNHFLRVAPNGHIEVIQRAPTGDVKIIYSHSLKRL